MGKASKNTESAQFPSRYLYLLRHAKSSWKQTDIPDVERPLNSRGRKDIPVIAASLRKHNCTPQAIVSSISTRTIATARGVATQLRFPLTSISYAEQLYESSADEIFDFLRTFPAALHSVLVVGHNPGLQQLAYRLVKFDEPNLPTGGLIGIHVTAAKWKDLSPDVCQLLFFDAPKISGLSNTL